MRQNAGLAQSVGKVYFCSFSRKVNRVSVGMLLHSDFQHRRLPFVMARCVPGPGMAPVSSGGGVRRLVSRTALGREPALAPREAEDKPVLTVSTQISSKVRMREHTKGPTA